MIKIEQELEFLENCPYHVIKCPDCLSLNILGLIKAVENYYAFNVRQHC